jgi:hypothetical protein
MAFLRKTLAKIIIVEADASARIINKKKIY